MDVQIHTFVPSEEVISFSPRPLLSPGKDPQWRLGRYHSTYGLSGEEKLGEIKNGDFSEYDTIFYILVQFVKAVKGRQSALLLLSIAVNRSGPFQLDCNLTRQSRHKFFHIA